MFNKMLLKQEWKRKGFKGIEIAAALEMTPQNLSNIINNNDRGFSADDAVKICNLIESPMDMFKMEDETNGKQ